MSSKLRMARGSDGMSLVYWCQGCEDTHQVRIRRGDEHPSWNWDGNTEAPTFDPSVLTTSGHFTPNWKPGMGCWCKFNAEHPEDPGPACVRCHTFVRGGIVEFLGDCTHALAGQKLPLPDWPYKDGEYGGVEPLP